MTNLLIAQELNGVHGPAGWLPRVLVVEDDVTSGSLWDQIVHSAFEKAEVSWTTNVTEAARQIRSAAESKCPFDLVISDVFVSGSRTGIDLWVEFHELLQERFLLVSSVDHLQISKFVGGKGEPIYLKKPVEISEAVKLVYSMITRS